MYCRRACSVVFFLLHSDAFVITKPMTSASKPTFLSDSKQPEMDSPSSGSDDVPSMDWLTNSFNSDQEDNGLDLSAQSPYMEEHSADGGLGDVPIPTTGVSVSDEMDRVQKDNFVTEVVPIKGLEKGVRAAQIVTSATTDSFEPVRYLVGLSKIEGNDKAGEHSVTDDAFVMIDVPPFSDELKGAIQKYMGPNGKLSAILVTSRDCIHYNDAPGVFTIRRADLLKWEKAFPDTQRIAYRLDIPRDCRESITQCLDGYGPFALDEESNTNVTFVETGRPLTYAEWDHDTAQNILAGKQTPPDDEREYEEDKDYSPEGIRSREEGKRVLAVYTPGRSYGSMSYVFPELQLCASGFTVPIEDNRNEENTGIQSAGPTLDCRGYITTSRAGIERQMESARNLINSYIDRFNVILPSRGDPYMSDDNEDERKQELLGIIDQYEKIGQIYEQLGITSSEDTF